MDRERREWIRGSKRLTREIEKFVFFLLFRRKIIIYSQPNIPYILASIALLPEKQSNGAHKTIYK